MSDSLKNQNIPADSFVGMFSYSGILKLVWPLALGMINGAVMHFVDRAYLAHDSMTALEAALPAGMLVWILGGFAQSVISYASVVIGQYFGAGEHANCRATFRVALYLALGASVLAVPLTALGLGILSSTTSSLTLLADERKYFSILMLGSFGLYLQTATSAYFTGLGRTRVLFFVSLLGNIVNLALDPILIFGWFGLPSLGIAGAACATISSMAFQGLILYGLIRRERVSECRVPWSEIRAIAKKILRYGSPYAFYMILNMLSFAIFVFVTEGVGEMELAASNACFTLNYLLFSPMEGFSIAASTLVAQAIGAGRPDLAARGVRRTLLLGLSFAALFSCAGLFFSHEILNLFASQAGEQAAEFYALGRILLFLMAAWLMFDAADIIISGALKGAGDTKFVMTWMLVCAFLVWLPSVFVTRAYSNTMPALWATMIGYVILLCVGTVGRWFAGKWRTIKVV